jgi:hypothetical protein
MRRRRLAIAALVTATLLGCSSSPYRAGPNDPAKVERVREVLHLDYPYRIVSTERFLDGGSRTFSVVDRDEQTMDLCSDGRGRPVPLPGSDGKRRLPPRHLWLGRYMDDPGARELPVHGEEENAILDLLEIVSSEQFPPRVIHRFVTTPESMAVLVRGDRYTEVQRRALWAGILAWQRRRVDPAGEVF